MHAFILFQILLLYISPNQRIIDMTYPVLTARLRFVVGVNPWQFALSWLFFQRIMLSIGLFLLWQSSRFFVWKFAKKS